MMLIIRFIQEVSAVVRYVTEVVSYKQATFRTSAYRSHALPLTKTEADEFISAWSTINPVNIWLRWRIELIPESADPTIR